MSDEEMELVKRVFVANLSNPNVIAPDVICAMAAFEAVEAFERAKRFWESAGRRREGVGTMEADHDFLLRLTKWEREQARPVEDRLAEAIQGGGQ